jgi:hypothetical protein
MITDPIQVTALNKLLGEARPLSNEQRAKVTGRLRSMIRRGERCRIDPNTWAEIATMTGAADAIAGMEG